MKLGPLEQSLGHTFKSPELLERALTHRSWAHEKYGADSEEKVRRADNESLEFVGDAVLGLVVAEYLFLDDRSASEGTLSQMKHHLVSSSTLARVGEQLKLGEHLRVSRGEEKTGGRKKTAILENTVEAVIAAIFLDGGYSAARAFVRRVFAEEFRNATPQTVIDYKSVLQERLQAEKLAPPEYSVVRTEGPPHARQFFVEATWSGGSSEGSGTSIKSAEMVAASNALKVLENGKSPAGI